MPQLEFHFDFGSPNAYLAHCAIPQIEKRTGAHFEYIPILLGGVFKATNNASPMVAFEGILNKPDYAQVETRRFLKHFGLKAYQPNPHFPVNTLTIMRGAMYAQQAGIMSEYVDAVYHHMWQGAKKLDDLDVLRACLDESALPADLILDATTDPAVKAQLVAHTKASVDKGTFGSPTFYLDGEIFFGKECLREIEYELMKT